MGYCVIGFNGKSVSNAMGLKTPVVLDDATNRLGLALSGKPPQNWWPQHGVGLDLYTLCGDLGAYEEETVVLYAASSFLMGVDEACIILDIPSELTWRDPFYVGAMHLSRARTIADDWALTLLKAAHTACSREAYSLAYIENNRAAFVLTALK